jgi:heptaprenyl diphosphate synthase
MSARLGLLAACAVAVYVFEGLVPMPLPWARLGLSNIVVVVALFGYGFGFAFAANAVRIVAGNLLLGIVMSPAFIFSALGSTAALVVMAGVRWRLVPPFSIVGVSMLGAVVNNATQVVVFTALFSASPIAGRLLGSFILLGLVVGCVTGAVAARIIDKVGLARFSALG